jgi:UDP-N-acetylglucosamine acyltransferase
MALSGPRRMRRGRIQSLGSFRMSAIHATAIVDPAAALGADVEIGPYCVIGPHVRLGDGTRLLSHVVVDGHTTIGRNCRLFPFACIGMMTQDLKYAGGVTYAEIGDGTTLREYATVHTGTKEGEVTRVGSNCLIMAYCHVAHGCVVGNGVILSNVSQLAGEVQVHDGVIIAGMTGVHQFCRIGAHAMVGGASRIVMDCPPYMITEGNPAEVRGPNAIGLQRRNVPEAARSALKQAYRLLYREGLNRTQALARIRQDLPDLPEMRLLAEFYEQSQRGVT